MISIRNTCKRENVEIGILALQGGFEAHAKALEKCGAGYHYVRKSEDLKGLQGLIFPGGESTSQLDLISRVSLRDPLTGFFYSGKPVFGTCAGVLVMKELGMLDISIERNTYGSQKDSFETTLNILIPEKKEVGCVFIRAPKITRIHSDIHILSTFEGSPVLIQKENALAATFHPELTLDTTIHRYFLKLCEKPY